MPDAFENRGAELINEIMERAATGSIGMLLDSGCRFDRIRY